MFKHPELEMFGFKINILQIISLFFTHSKTSGYLPTLRLLQVGENQNYI